MGQSATLYRISNADFPKIVESPDNFELFKIARGFEVFEKSFEGLQFVIAKGLDKESKELVELIFYPMTSVGDQVDFSSIDFENLPDDFDFERQPIYYNEPRRVSEISDLLDTISLDDFQNNFDHNELNREDIYPSGIWNDKTDDDTAFNVKDMTSEFQRLTIIFKIAKENNEYLLSYVG